MQPASSLNSATARRALLLLNPRRLCHRAEIEFADRLPVEGGAVIVSNHGRLDFDCFILMSLILRYRSRLARLMADHLWFGLPGIRRVWALAGAVDGTRENAARLLGQGELVLAYPGGVREIMNSRFGHEHIDWSDRTGFASVAIAAGVPVIPVVGIGVNNGFRFLTSGRLLGKVTFQWILRLGPGYEGYRDPLTLGILPLPLPFSSAIHFPLPCKVRYVVGEPIYPAGDTQGAKREVHGAGGEDLEVELAARVADAMHELIERHGRP